MILKHINKKTSIILLITALIVGIIYRILFGGILNQKYGVYDLPDAMNALNSSWRYNQEEKDLVLKKWKKEHNQLLINIAKGREKIIKIQKEYDRTYLKSYRDDANAIIEKEKLKQEAKAIADAKTKALKEEIARNKQEYKAAVSKNNKLDLSDYLDDEFFHPDCDSLRKEELLKVALILESIKAPINKTNPEKAASKKDSDPFSVEGLTTKKQ